MDIGQQRQTRAIFRLEEANLYYTAATGVQNERHMDILKSPYLGMRQYLLRQTGYPWDGDVVNLRAALVSITTPSVWSKIFSVECPVQFSDEEKRLRWQNHKNGTSLRSYFLGLENTSIPTWKVEPSQIILRGRWTGINNFGWKWFDKQRWASRRSVGVIGRIRIKMITVCLQLGRSSSRRQSIMSFVPRTVASLIRCSCPADNLELTIYLLYVHR
jgi:hypothetical protein